MSQIQFKNLEEGRQYIVTNPFNAYSPEGAPKYYSVDKTFTVGNIRNLGTDIVVELDNMDWIYGDLEDHCCFE